jgi:hypothetical protein
MAKMKYQRYAGAGIEGYFGRPPKQSEAEVEATKIEMIHFANKYWAERGKEAKVNAAKKAREVDIQKTNPPQSKNSKSGISPIRHKQKEHIGVIRLTKIRNRIKIELECQFETEAIHGSMHAVIVDRITNLRDLVSGDKPIDLRNDNIVVGQLKIELNLIDECIANGNAIKKIYSS